MWEKYEKFWILGILALAVYYFYKKGKMTGTSVPGSAPADFSSFLADFGGSGSIVNTTAEAGNIQPAQATRPVAFNPAQPSTVPYSQRVSAGQFTYMTGVPVLRNTLAYPGVRPTYLA